MTDFEEVCKVLTIVWLLVHYVWLVMWTRVEKGGLVSTQGVTPDSLCASRYCEKSFWKFMELEKVFHNMRIGENLTLDSLLIVIVAQIFLSAFSLIEVDTS